MVINEKFTNLFTTLKTNYTDIKFLQNVDSDSVDSLYISKHGNRTLNTYSTIETVEKICFVLNTYYLNKWNTLFEYQNKIYNDILEGNTTVKTENIGNDKYIQTNNLASYDSNELNSDSSIEYNKDSKTNTTTTKESIFNGYKSKFSYLQDSNFYDIVFTDVNTIITLNIYE